jgi:hypothetical protein
LIEIGRHIVEFEQQGDGSQSPTSCASFMQCTPKELVRQRLAYSRLGHPKKKCENKNMRKSYALTNAIWTIAALSRSPGRLQEVTA